MIKLSKMITSNLEIFSEPVHIDGRPCWIFNHKTKKWLRSSYLASHSKRHGGESVAINDGHFYWKIGSHKRLKLECCAIHRLLAIYFIPNPNNLPYVNHIDENKQNNDLSNLEWCTLEYNNKHSFNKSVELINGDFRIEFESIDKAGEWLAENKYAERKNACALVSKAANRCINKKGKYTTTTAYGFVVNFIGGINDEHNNAIVANI